MALNSASGSLFDSLRTRDTSVLGDNNAPTTVVRVSAATSTSRRHRDEHGDEDSVADANSTDDEEQEQDDGQSRDQHETTHARLERALESLNWWRAACVTSLVITIVLALIIVMRSGRGGMEPLGLVAPGDPSTAASQGARVHLRTLVVLAQYGTSHWSFNLATLSAIGEWGCSGSGPRGQGVLGVEEEEEACFDVDLVYLCNPVADITPWLYLLPPRLRTHTTVRVFPDDVAWGLPLQHRSIFAERKEHYDVFVYLEADMLVHRYNMQSWWKHEQLLRGVLGTRELLQPPPPNKPNLAHHQFAVGFIRYEFGETAVHAGGSPTFPDDDRFHRFNARFHGRESKPPEMPPLYIVAGRAYVHMHLWPYAAAHVLTRAQLDHFNRHVNDSWRLQDPRHNVSFYDFRREDAAGGPYWNAFHKLVPVDDFADHLIHHQPDNYPNHSSSLNELMHHMQTGPRQELLPLTKLVPT